jgi:hypothetical protein
MKRAYRFYCFAFVAGALTAAPALWADEDHRSGDQGTKSSESSQEHAPAQKKDGFWKTYYGELNRTSQFDAGEFRSYDKFFSRDNTYKRDLFEIRRELELRLYALKKEPKGLSDDAQKARGQAIKTTTDSLEKVNELFKRYNAYVEKNPEKGKVLAAKRLLEISRRLAADKASFREWAKGNRGKGFDSLFPPPRATTTWDDYQYYTQMAVYSELSKKKKLKAGDELALLGAPTAENRKTRSALIDSYFADLNKQQKRQKQYTGPSIGTAPERTAREVRRDQAEAEVRRSLAKSDPQWAYLSEEEQKRRVEEVLDEIDIDPWKELASDHHFAEDMAAVSERAREATMSNMMREIEREAERD